MDNQRLYAVGANGYDELIFWAESEQQALDAYCNRYRIGCPEEQGVFVVDVTDTLRIVEY